MRRPFLTTVFVFASSAAQAELVVCNDTDAKASVAIGYNDGGVWTSEGWWNVAPESCSVVQGGDLSKRYYYYRVTSQSYAWPGEKYFFCTDQDAFTIAGDTDCGARGFDRSEFRQIEVGTATSFTVHLTAPDDGAGTSAPQGQTTIDPPGTHGEPYSVQGILSHCEVFDASMACEIHADGYRYVAYSTAPTPQSLLEDLMAAGENRPIGVSGDMISYEGNVAEITIRDYTFAGEDPYSAHRAAMQGLWRSLDDPNYEVLIFGGIFEELYQQLPTDTSTMFFTQNCEGSPGTGPAILLKSYDRADEDRCMFVLGVGNTLELAPAGVMNDLRFYKVN
ncbi:DUF1036 domain-containing protein [Shimia thalassica]|uniref:DUF1036 domain-containing protein n=1 Tax=Shimia thalassica TaxID=1715693 RepID=UPI001C0A0C34|nr:DUF1036 domain-containing protein [Shimia thalassica]MBU2942504.1 DUF1036 domain-containing protein [Shimia thalassica]MDO6504433.1 DUF1036 domain-containing protein [Shimia thalassica]